MSKAASVRERGGVTAVPRRWLGPTKTLVWAFGGENVTVYVTYADTTLLLWRRSTTEHHELLSSGCWLNAFPLKVLTCWVFLLGKWRWWDDEIQEVWAHIYKSFMSCRWQRHLLYLPAANSICFKSYIHEKTGLILFHFILEHFVRMSRHHPLLLALHPVTLYLLFRGKKKSGYYF